MTIFDALPDDAKRALARTELARRGAPLDLPASGRDLTRLTADERAELASIMALLPAGVDPDGTCDQWELWRLSDVQLGRLEALVLLVDAP